MRKTRALLVLFCLLLPSGAFAAQFAKQSLFLSKTGATEGETVLIHAVVSNNNSSEFSGTLLFTDGLNSIGSVPVALAAEESAVASVSWKPAAGEHPVSATLKDKSGASVETQKQIFLIAPKPSPATSSQTAAVESSEAIRHGIEQVSPQAAQYSEPVFTLIDGGREKIAGVLDDQLAITKTKLGPNAGSAGEILGAEATQNATKNPSGAFFYMLQTLYFYLLTLLRFIVGSAGVFYPVVAIAFFYLLFKTYRRFRRAY